MCGEKKIIKNGYKIRKIEHLTDLFWKRLYKIQIPKYICSKCKNSFSEHFTFAPPNCKYSLETLYAILNSLREPSTNFSSVAKQFGISCQECINLFNKYVSIPKIIELPIILCFDEKFINRTIATNGYAFIIVDFINKKIFDILSSRKKEDLYRYFSKFPKVQREKVKYIIIDMNSTYLEIAKVFFPNATIIVDSFHVVRLVRNAFDKIRKDIQKNYDNGADSLEQNTNFYYMLKTGKDSLLKFYTVLNNERRYNHKLRMMISERTFVNYTLNIDQSLKKAYYLLQDYYEFNKYETDETVKDAIEEITKKFIESEINEFIETAYTIIRWKEYIINSFTKIFDKKKYQNRRLSNGPVESLNNLIERIHVIGNGYKDFPLFKKVCFCKINKTITFNF